MMLTRPQLNLMLRHVALTTILCVGVGVSTPSIAQKAPPSQPITIDAGLVAYESGDFETAYKALLPLANADHSAAQYLVGIMYIEGRGVSANPYKGVEWLVSAATQDNVNAQQLLGDIYLNGNYGIEKNSAAAAQWLQLPANMGDPVSQFTIGLAFMMGGTLEPNPEQAVEWVLKAAQSGHKEAEHLLARSYLSGYGVEENPSEAAIWFRKAAIQGVAQSQNDLGSLYVQGRGVAKDLSLAYAWFLVSEASGLSTAAVNRQRLVGALTADNRSIAENTARQLAREIENKQNQPPK